jgi:SAM-dependent methyltransferase
VRDEGSMNEADASFVAAMPELYDRCLGPMLFSPYADDLRARAREFGARRVLEIAAGTGIVTRVLAEVLPDAEIEATDLNAAMVRVGAGRTPEAVRWSVADAQALPFADGRFDLIVCQFGIMFFPDRLAAFREARRVLAPEGSYLFNVWSGLEENDVARIVSQAAEAVFPDNPPAFLKRTPHGHGDPVPIVADLRAAGFTDIACDLVAKRSRSTAGDAAVGLCQGTPLNHEIMTRDPQRLATVVDAATRALAAELGGNEIDGAMRAYVITARSS